MLFPSSGSIPSYCWPITILTFTFLFASATRKLSETLNLLLGSSIPSSHSLLLPLQTFVGGGGRGLHVSGFKRPPPPCECKDRGVCQCPAPSLLFPRERISLGTWGDAAASKLQWPSYLWPLPHSPGVTGVPCPDFHARVGIQPWVFTLVQQGL